MTQIMCRCGTMINVVEGFSSLGTEYIGGMHVDHTPTRCNDYLTARFTTAANLLNEILAKYDFKTGWIVTKPAREWLGKAQIISLRVLMPRDFDEMILEAELLTADLTSNIPNHAAANDATIPLPPDTHPWGAFLQARVEVMKWLRKEMHESNEKIAGTLSMDEDQVTRIFVHIDGQQGPAT